MNNFKSILEINLNNIASIIESEWKADNTEEAKAILNSQTPTVKEEILDRLSMPCREALK